VVENQRGGRLGDGGRVCGARAWTDETNDVRGENFWLAGGGSVLKGRGVGVGRHVEAEREREREGGPRRGVEQRGGVASQRPDRGVCGRRVAAR
jgi:hypothetical protein